MLEHETSTAMQRLRTEFTSRLSHQQQMLTIDLERVNRELKSEIARLKIDLDRETSRRGSHDEALYFFALAFLLILIATR